MGEKSAIYFLTQHAVLRFRFRISDRCYERTDCCKGSAVGDNKLPALTRRGHELINSAEFTGIAQRRFWILSRQRLTLHKNGVYQLCHS
jgi:hypothetical protein